MDMKIIMLFPIIHLIPIKSVAKPPLSFVLITYLLFSSLWLEIYQFVNLLKEPLFLSSIFWFFFLFFISPTAAPIFINSFLLITFEFNSFFFFQFLKMEHKVIDLRPFFFLNIVLQYYSLRYQLQPTAKHVLFSFLVSSEYYFPFF